MEEKLKAEEEEYARKMEEIRRQGEERKVFKFFETLHFQ